MEMTDQRDPRTYEIIGAVMEVHRALGHGLLEAIYQEALAFEFEARAIVFRREAPLTVTYKGQRLRTFYKVDFICFDSIVVELKALARLSGKEDSQMINYLRASELTLGVLLNFGAQSLEYKRIIHPNVLQS